MFYFFRHVFRHVFQHVLFVSKGVHLRRPPSFFIAMSSKRPTKRKRGLGPMIVGDLDSAELVTPKVIFETKRDGTVVSKQVWESLDKPTDSALESESSSAMPYMDYEPVDIPSPPPETSTSRVSKSKLTDLFHSHKWLIDTTKLYPAVR